MNDFEDAFMASEPQAPLAAHPSIQKKQRRVASLQRQYKAVFNTPEGRRVLQDLISFSGLFTSSVRFGDKMSVIEGRRELVLRILSFTDMSERATFAQYMQEVHGVKIDD